MTEQQAKQKKVLLTYTSNIDQVFRMTKDEAERHLKRLELLMKKEPGKFDTDCRNLKSFIEDLDE